jgi:hypothetical protein
MSPVIRPTIIAVLGAFGVLASAQPAGAQYFPGPGMYGGGVRYPGYGIGMPGYGAGFSTRNFYPIPPNYFGGLPPQMPVRPLPGINGFNPLMYNPYNPVYNPANNAAVTYYYLNRISYPPAYGGSGSTYAPPAYTPSAGYGGGYTSGAGGAAAYARDFERAQQYATARSSIADQAAYEKRAAAAPVAANAGPRVAEPPAVAPKDLLDALAVVDESRLYSGDYLNRIAAEVTALEGRGARATPTQLGPTLLKQVRFGGSPAGDALNVLRLGGRVEFPAAFDSVEGLRDLRAELEKDLLAAVGPVAQGKPADSVKAAKLEGDVKRAQAALAPALGTLAFEDAAAARRFLNRLEAAAKAIRDPAAAGLVNPKWETDGVSVADLVKHMAKHKVQFGRADPGDEEVYRTVHHALSAYLVALQQNEAAKKK